MARRTFLPEELNIATQLVHAGERRAVRVGEGAPVSTPVYTTSVYTYATMEEFDRVFAGEDQGYVYARFGNPTVTAFEEAIQTLEAGAGACGFASGMAALHAALFICELSSDSTVLASQDLYGATTQLLYNVFGSFGVRVITCDFNDTHALREQAQALRPRALVAETISNPLLKVCDITRCAEIAHEVGAQLIVDNTFASPYLCQPLKHGADIVVHSATKYLGGHGDTMGGAVIVRDEANKLPLVGAMKTIGGVLGVWEAHEILRGVKTLGVRMERQCANAGQLAERLMNHPQLARVRYPGLENSDSEMIAQRMLRAPHAGALVTIELKDDSRASAFRFMDALQLCVRSTSLGDVFTSVLHPATASHREHAPLRRAKLGIGDGLVRISVGIEDITDIIADVERALES